MAMEMAASRFLAPYYGTSMIVWANIIGLILLSLSLGYWIGGRWADHRPDGHVLMMISLIAGALISLLPLWGRLIFPALSAGILSTPIWVIVCSFFAILLVFAPPVFLLAMVSPFAVRLVSNEAEQVGKAAGNLYAFSTLGSLMGTFGTAFGTIPYLGARETIFIWSIVLILVSLWGLRFSKLRRLGILLVLPILIYVLTKGTLPSIEGQRVLWSKDTLYQYVRVAANPQGNISLIYNEGGGVQSVHRLHDALSKQDYYDDYLLLPYFIDNPRQVLVLGSAGGTIPRLMAKYVKPAFSSLAITGVEIDPDVIGLDQKYFGLQPDDARIVNQDARVFLGASKKFYDVVIVDCYSQQIYIPFHLSTVEFFQTVRSRLSAKGVVALNINATSVNSKLLTSLEKTVHSVFPAAYLVKARGEYNYILIGAKSPLHLSALQNIDTSNPLNTIRQEWPEQWKPLQPEQFKNGMLLTDNRAPTEMMTDSMIFGAAAGNT